ncbi:hypothetical protein PSACC_01383 [Paramicrosporidium saccamoebae]|uniref:Uncharacterized protein n=1 Tax=Paramicrosporidium saccamoebae TaxID=1246581 RepID=A0A2H9TM51_9FUNG|nr:hypothetical protein PSACC_01383 [Paramicrosporidium saccamoebae]
MATALEMDVAKLETEEINSLIDEVMLTLLENNKENTTAKIKKPKIHTEPKSKVHKESNKVSEFPGTTESEKTKTSKTLSKVSNPDKKGKSDGEATIDRLKAYVFKCGVRKVWKKELDGLSTKQSIARLEEILRSLGMEGRPTLEKCSAIKERREFEEELKAVESNAVLPTRLRSRGASATSAPRQIDTDEEETIQARPPRLNLAAFGDPEE